MSSNKPSMDPSVTLTSSHQQKINRFAILNAWLDELKEELGGKEKWLKNTSEVEDQIDELSLTGDFGESGPELRILLGDNAFVVFDEERGKNHLQSLKSSNSARISQIQAKIAEIKKEMSTLKTELYSDIGKDAINLEQEEEGGDE